jgi:hypothetical protein
LEFPVYIELGVSWKQGNGSNNVGTAEDVSWDGGCLGELWDADSKICRIWVWDWLQNVVYLDAGQVALGKFRQRAA